MLYAQGDKFRGAVGRRERRNSLENLAVCLRLNFQRVLCD